MHAIVSVLDQSGYARVEALWRELEIDCGLEGIRATPIPHFSWHIAQNYDFPRLNKTLSSIAGRAQPFSARAGGLGLFTRPNPVVYLPIVRTAVLSKVHQLIWERVDDLSTLPSLHYTPGHWMPHITLALGDVDDEALVCTVKKLAFQPNPLEITVDNLAVVYQIDSQVGELMTQFNFTG